MEKKNDHKYVLIMAGGSGTRLFPRSTEDLPKQFQRIIGVKTLIEQAYDRAIKITDKNHIYISSNHKYINLIKRYLPEIIEENYITEPVKRNTGPAIALATAIIYKKDPKAIIVSVHSDHLVEKEDEYIRVIKNGIKVIEENSKYILCVGINPTSPHTGLGYIEKSKQFTKIDNQIVYQAKRFVEKPNLELAQEYLSSGNFYWNAGYFIWQAKHFLSELEKYGPKIHIGIHKIVNSINKKNYVDVLNKEFVKLDGIAIDNLIMEKTANLLVLPADIGWSDIGSWDVVSDILGNQPRDFDGNYKEGKIISIDTHNTTILSHNESRLIATVGLDNLIIVTTEDAIVIVPKGRSEDVKKIISELEKRNQ